MSSDAHPAALPPPLLDIPTAKQKKYDRQLRLWGASGQEALEESHILLINNGPGVTGVETLKNLVLPGLGSFTIADSAVVTEADLGVNFFLDDASLNKFRAEETVKFLVELNPAVQGHSITEYSIILVAAPIDPAILSLIQSQAQELHLPLFYLHSVGFYSTFSISLPLAFPIVDTHPDQTSTTDLRLLSPWPALEEFAAKMTAGLGTNGISQHDKGHIPWVALLLCYLEIWKGQNGGQLPDTYKQKSVFREMVRAGDPHEENFDEACANVLKSLNMPSVPSIVREIFAAPETENLNAESNSFWYIAKAVQSFYETHGQLPIPGAVPDMKARSADYIQLQNIYKTKARQDCAEVLESVRMLEKNTGRSPQLAVDEKEVENFCKGVSHIHLVRGRPIHVSQAGEPITFGDRAKAMAFELTNPESQIGLYVVFLAWDKFVATHTSTANEAGGEAVKVPGSTESDVEPDTEKVTGIAHKIIDSLLREAGTEMDDPEYTELKDHVGKLCLELVRAGGGELHNIASLTGGLVSQEIIKVITKQYIPVDNTCVFDGIASKSYVLRV
nr:nedd8-activating enzyme e1 regulatory subunit [Quercus suber]